MENKSITSPHLIPLNEAVMMNRRYRAEKNSLADKQANPGVLPICETFDRAAFDAVLAQEGCTGIRIYYSTKEDKSICLVAVGVNDQDEDMINTNEGSLVIEKSRRCPPDCPPPSVLNED